MFEKLFGRKKSGHEQTDIAKRFNLHNRVGQGSMSKVWKATDLRHGRLVALKVLDKQKTQEYEARFADRNKPSEGEVALTLNHPNIVKTYEYGWTTDDEMFLVMEFVEGVGLSLLVDLQNEEMKRYRLRYMIQIGEALHYFHQQNWIHRDICPRNVMVAEDKTIKLIDFGLVVPNTPEFRKPGNRTGTASYMAPELIKRQPTDHRLDIFSFSVTCFEMYSRRFPWDAALTIDAVLQHINKPPLNISEVVPNIDRQIGETIMKGLSANPADRWQTVSEMVAQIREAEARIVKAARAAAASRAAAKSSQTAVPKTDSSEPTKDAPASLNQVGPTSKPAASTKPAPSTKPAASAKPPATKSVAAKPATEVPAKKRPAEPNA